MALNFDKPVYWPESPEEMAPNHLSEESKNDKLEHVGGSCDRSNWRQDFDDDALVAWGC